MRASLACLLLAVGLVSSLWVPGGLADPTIDVLDAPEVVVANDPETMRDDPETEAVEFDPEYVFSAQIQVTNDGDERSAQPEAIVYPDQDVEGECPREQAFRIDFVGKRLNMSPGEQVQIGGEANRSTSQDEAYWPMAVSQEYRNAQTGSDVPIEEGVHTFCAAIRATGEDPACDREPERTCVLATAPFESYVREENQPPHITSLSLSPEDPRPGQAILFEADAVDNSTQPREDTLTYTWKLNGTEASGQSVQHTFAREGVHEVDLVVGDGFDEAHRTIRVPVGDVSLDGEEPAASPVPGWLASIVLVFAVAMARRRRG